MDVSEDRVFDVECERTEGDAAGVGENCIEWIRGQKIVTAMLAGGSRYANRVLKYAEEYPDEVRIAGKNSDGSFVAHLPLSYIRITHPTCRQLTEEQKQRAAETLKKARKEQQNGRKD